MSVVNAVDIPSLEAQVHLLTASTALGQLLQRAMGMQHYLLLEVLRQKLPDLYTHSALMMCAVYLAVAVHSITPMLVLRSAQVYSVRVQKKPCCSTMSVPMAAAIRTMAKALRFPHGGIS